MGPLSKRLCSFADSKIPGGLGIQGLAGLSLYVLQLMTFQRHLLTAGFCRWWNTSMSSHHVKPPPLYQQSRGSDSRPENDGLCVPGSENPSIVARPWNVFSFPWKGSCVFAKSAFCFPERSLLERYHQWWGGEGIHTSLTGFMTISANEASCCHYNNQINVFCLVQKDLRIFYLIIEFSI